ncbi:uncharacterized protein DEA37_0009880, partial [Paragonimus westermani]
ATSGLQFDLLVDEVLRKIEKLTTKELAWRYFPELHYWLQVNAGVPRNPSHFKNSKSTNEFREASRVLRQLAHEMKRRRTIGNYSAAHFSGLSNISSSCDSPDLPGTWVECSLCKKWRYLPHVHDPSQIVVDWHCGFPQDATDTTGLERVSLIQTACDRPQSPLPDVQEDDCIFTEFAVGSIVWAKLQGYPEWPAMVYYNEDGRYAEYDVNTRDVVHYHVVFLDPTRSTISRVHATKLRRFTPPAEGYMDKVCLRFRKHVAAAVQEAQNALLLPIQERIKVYGYDFYAKAQNSEKIRKSRRRCNGAFLPDRTLDSTVCFNDTRRKMCSNSAFTQTEVPVKPVSSKSLPRLTSKSTVSSSLEPVIFPEQDECIRKTSNVKSSQPTQWESSTKLRILPNFVKSPPRRDSSAFDSASHSLTNSPSFLRSADKTYFDWFHGVTPPISGSNELSPMGTNSVELLHDFQDHTETRPRSNTLQKLMWLAFDDLQVYSPYIGMRKSNKNVPFFSVSSSKTWEIHRVPFHLQLIPS